MRSITVCGRKGGVGKSLTSRSLAVEFARYPTIKKILIVDCDSSRNSTNAVIENLSQISLTLFDLFADKKCDICSTIYPGNDQHPKIDILASDDRLDSIDAVLINRKNKETILSRAVNQLDYDLVIYDTPPNNGILTQNALAASDSYIIPADHDINALDGVFGVKNIVDDLFEEGSIDKKPSFLGLFFTKVEENTNATKMVDDIAIKEFGNSIIPVRIPKSVHTKEAILAGTTLQFQRHHPVCKAYANITGHIAKKLNIKKGGNKHARA